MQNDFIKNLMAGSFKNPAFQAPQPAAQPQPTTDAIAWANKTGSYNGMKLDQFNDDSNVSIFLDPSSRRIKISAPQYYVDSEEFKTQVLPAFQQLAGKELTDTQFTSLVNSDMLKDIQQQANDIKQRYQAVMEYRNKFPKASENDAMTYLRNVAAGLNSDKDENTQLVTSYGADGKQNTESVASFVKRLSSYSDERKGRIIKDTLADIDDPSLSERDRAVKLSLLNVAQEKGLFSANGQTQFEMGANNFLAQSDSGLIGNVVNKLYQPIGWIAGDGRSIAETARDDIKNDPRSYLSNTESATKIGSITGTAFATGADIVAAAPLGGGALAGAARGLSTTAKGAELAQRLQAAVKTLEAGGTLSKTAAATIRNVPSNLAFGAEQSINDGDLAGSAKDFAINVATDAALLGTAKLGANVLRAVDLEANPTLYKVNDAVARGLARGTTAVGDAPILKNVKKFAANFVDSEAPIRSMLRSGYGKGAITKDDLKAGMNDIAIMQQRGAPEVKQFMQQSPEFDTLVRTSMDVGKLPEADQEAAQRFITATQEKQYADSGRIKLSKARQEEVDAAIASGEGNELFQKYRDDLVQFNAAVTKFGEDRGLLDKDIIDAMRADPTFAKGYVALQRSIDPTQFSTANTTRYRDRDPIKRLKGGEREFTDPYQAALQRLHALADLDAQNRVRTLVARAVDEGWAGGRILQQPQIVKERNDIRVALKGERASVDSIVTTVNKGLAEDISTLVDDLESLYSPQASIVTERLQQAVDDISEKIQTDHKFQAAIKQLTEGENPYTPEQAATEIMATYRKEIVAKVDTALKETMGPEERRFVTNELQSIIDNNTQLNQAARVDEGVDAAQQTGRQELMERQKAQRALNAELSTVDKADPGTISFHQGGTKGWMQIDDPVLVDYFRQPVRSAAEDGWIAKVATAVSRLFRLGTTGLNPVFLLVNPTRDIAQSAVVQGMDVLSPQRTLSMYMEAAGFNADEAAQVMREVRNSVEMTTQISASREPLKMVRQAEDQFRQNQKGVKETVVKIGSQIKHEPLRTLEAPFNEAELIVRQRNAGVAYQRAIARGATPEMAKANAIFAARETTANFMNVGRKVSQLVRTMPYLTAAINGKASFLRVWSLDPVGVTLRMAAGFVAPVIYLTTQNLDTDEKAATYFDIPEWERRNNFIIVLGDNQIIKIPMPQEMAAITNPFVENVETMHGLSKPGWEKWAKAVLGQSPISLTGLATTNSDGQVDVRAGLQGAASSVVPQIARPAIDFRSGKNSFTGADIEPSDEELYDSGQVEPGQEIKDGDRTFKGQDSKVLRKVADATGISQAKLQNVIQNYTGSVGGMLLNGIDTLAGAPEDQRGGKGLLDNIAKRYFGKSYSQASQDYYRNVNQLESQRNTLLKRLESFNQEAFYADDPNSKASLMAQRAAVIDDYGEKVADFVDRYSKFYDRAGGFKPFQMDAIVKLLDLGPDQGTFANDSYQSDLIQQARNESRSDAVRRATDLGLPTSNERDRYGRVLVDDAGNPYDDYSKTSLTSTNINTRVYGSPKQAAYEFAQIVKADKRAGIRSLYDEQQQFFKKLEPLYDKAKGLKGADAQAVYNEINALQEQYMTEVFDPRIRPLIEKYGPEILMNNKEIFEEIGSRIMVPGDYTPFFSKKKQPYLMRDVEAYLTDRYGVGEINQYNLPTDKQVLDIIGRINADLNNGNVASAKYKLGRVQNDVDSGRVYVDKASMEEIRQLVQAANRR